MKSILQIPCADRNTIIGPVLDKIYPAITNIGRKPTVSQEEVIGVETYLYDFAEEIYGEEISVALLSFKRTEMRFANVEELKARMESDIAEGKSYHLSKID